MIEILKKDNRNYNLVKVKGYGTGIVDTLSQDTALDIDINKTADLWATDSIFDKQENEGALSYQSSTLTASELAFGQQQNAGVLSTSVSTLASSAVAFAQQQNAEALSNSVFDYSANGLAFGQQQNAGVLSTSVSALAADSIFGSSNILSEDSSKNADSCNFLTLEQFLKNETTLNSIDQLITSDVDTVVQIIKEYIQKCQANFKNRKLIQLFLFVVILVSIFSTQFGGSRNLPVA